MRTSHLIIAAVIVLLVNICVSVFIAYQVRFDPVTRQMQILTSLVGHPSSDARRMADRGSVRFVREIKDREDYREFARQLDPATDIQPRGPVLQFGFKPALVVEGAALVYVDENDNIFAVHLADTKAKVGPDSATSD